MDIELNCSWTTNSIIPNFESCIKDKQGRIVHRSGLKKILFFNLKDSIFYKYICNIIFWWMFKDIVENQDFYSKKTSFEKIN